MSPKWSVYFKTTDPVHHIMLELSLLSLAARTWRDKSEVYI